MSASESSSRAAAQKLSGGAAGAGSMQLYCKAGADGKSLGDCPFTHYVSMVLHAKELPFELKPCAPDAKPDWLVNGYEGKMPCLVHNGEAYTDSAAIVRYLEYFFPDQNPLAPKELSEQIAEAQQVTNGLFPVLAKCIKNLDKAADAELLKVVHSELSNVNAHLEKTGGPYLCGEKLTIADCSYAPKLYHAKATLAQFKNTIIDPDLTALYKYMDTVFGHPAFVASEYRPDVIVWGWTQARAPKA